MERRSLTAAGFAAAAIVFVAAGAGDRAAADAAAHARRAVGAVAAGDLYRTLARRGHARVIVALRARVRGRSLASTRTAIAAARRRLLSRVRPADFAAVTRWRAIPATAGTVNRRGLRAVLRSPHVRAVGLVPRVRASLQESVPLIRAHSVHATGQTGAGVTVAIVDSGVDVNHPDVGNAVIAQGCFLTRETGGACRNQARRVIGPGSAQDNEGHGTSVASIITSDGAASPRGVAPDAKVVAAKVLDGDGVGNGEDILSALDWIINEHPEVKVVNLSLGGDELFASACDSASAYAIADASAMNALRARGALVFAAAGNDGSGSQLEEPACISSVVAVGAVYDAFLGPRDWETCTDTSTAPDQVVCFSDSSPALDLLAPGAMITTAELGGGTATWAGTSAATPHAVGVAALLFGARPDLSPEQVETALESTGARVNDPRNGLVFPRVDALAALQAVQPLPSSPGSTRLPDASAPFGDAAGDSGAGPDIGDVRITSRGGILEFSVGLANRDTLAPGEAVRLSFDRDRNPQTGDAGGEIAVGALESGRTVLSRWNGAQWDVVRELFDSSYTGRTLIVRLSQDELGIAGDFDFSVSSYASSIRRDLAPEAGSWPFPAHAVQVARSGTGAGTVTGRDIDCGTRCAATVRRGETLTLTPTPAAGSTFIEWSGACTGAGPCTLTIDGEKSVVARFELLRPLTVTKTGRGSGTVASVPAGLSCGATCVAEFANGTHLTLTAHAAPGSRFVEWRDGCTGAGACALTLDAPKSVSARFDDVAPPSARALAASARRGRRARLRFRLSDNSGEAAATISVLRGRKRLARIARRNGPAHGAVYEARWRVPRKLPRRRLAFCVLPADVSGNVGRSSCARVTVR